MRTRLAPGTRLPEAPSQVIDRHIVLRFTFDGATYAAYAGDTIASALVAAGVRTFSRSFKYHRPRGLLCVAGTCPNCLVQVGDEPNVRACRTPVTDGMAVTSQNVWPSLRHDAMSLTQTFDRFLPVGFYYKTFMRPRALWPAYERVLRRAAGLGQVGDATQPRQPAKLYGHADVAVVGGGPAGMRAAASAARTGARVVLLEAESALGGRLRWAPEVASDEGGALVTQLAEAIAGQPNVEVMTNTTVFGCYDHFWIGAARGEQLLKLRTRALVVATGAYDTPILFPNNDLPGIMFASAALRLVHLWGVRPGSRALVVSAERRGLEVALHLFELGIEVVAVAESRVRPDADLVEKLTSAGIPLYSGTIVAEANGRGQVESVTIAPLQGTHARATLACDLVLLAVGRAPASDLLFQAGGTLRWSDNLGAHVPADLPDAVFAAGEVCATQSLQATEREGQLAGFQAALAVGFGDEEQRADAHALEGLVRQASSERESIALYPLRPSKHDFVCWCEDVTSQDVRHAIEEGYDSSELLKRYSSIGMGPCQGKVCGVTAARLCSSLAGRTMAANGTTTARPPVVPVPLDTFAGRVMEPVRYTPLHTWHVEHSARMMNAGMWKRPEHYGDPVAEARAVRERVALMDVSTLGKLQITGPDTAALLDRIYTNRWDTLVVGRVRYGIMTGDDGVVLDDGVTARLANDLYYMTTASGGAAGIYEWIEWWLQSGWQLDVQVSNVVDVRAAINVAGPHARAVLAKLVPAAFDLNNEAFPYMHVRQTDVAGAPAILMRIGFTGELSFEIHVPSGYALHVWEALLEAGAEFGIVPFGVEAQRILRLEKGHILIGQDTDALSSPFAAGLAWAVKLDKGDFLGKPSLQQLFQDGTNKRLVGFEMIEDVLPEEMCQIVQPGDGPIGLTIIGRVTSVRRSPILGKVIGLCWLPAEMATPGQTFTVRVRGKLHSGRVVETPFYDPAGVRLRM